jgi:hypothetical protein
MLALSISVLLCVSAFILAEIGARFVIRRFGRYRVWAPGLRLELQVHPGIHPQLPERVRFEVNSYGERSNEAPQGPGVYRVLVAGSSGVECNLLDQHQCWTDVLQRRLERPERLRTLGASRVHVGNIGKSFVDASVLHHILIRLLPQYPALDLIVIMLGGLEATRWFVTAEKAAASTPQTGNWCFDCSPDRQFGWQLKRLALREIVSRVCRRQLRPTELQRNVGAWLVRARTMRAQAIEWRNYLPEPSTMLDAFERDLRLSLALAAEHAQRVIVVRPVWYWKTPLTIEEEARFWHGGAGWVQSQDVSAFYSHDSWCQLMSLLDERTVRAASDLGIQHVDPLAVIPPDVDHLYDHAHLTPAGAARLAQIVEEAICCAGEPGTRESVPFVPTTRAHEAIPVADRAAAATVRA